MIRLIKCQIKNNRDISGITINGEDIILDDNIYKPELRFDLINSVKSEIGAEKYFMNLGFARARINYNDPIYGYNWRPVGPEIIVDEEWKLISDISDSKRDYTKYVLYKISTYGRIMSPDGDIRDTRLFAPLADGYIKTCILKDNIRIHDLVMLAFNGPRPSDSHLVHHIDGDKANNHYLNLTWKTMSEKTKK